MEIVVSFSLCAILGMLVLILIGVRKVVRGTYGTTSKPQTKAMYPAEDAEDLGAFRERAGESNLPFLPKTLNARMTPSEIARDLREKGRQRAQAEANRQEKEKKNA